MITDEQAEVAVRVYHEGMEIPDRTMPALINDMRKAIEAYEQSKWVKFDADDLSTAPDSTADSLWSEAVIAITKGNHEPQIAQYHYGKHRFDVNDVIRWRYFPTFKE